MSQCKTCTAEFGVKFNRYVCARCQNGFCAGHLILSEYLTIRSDLMSTLKSGHGLCLECILEIWGKTDSDLEAPQGILGRLKKTCIVSWDSTTSIISNKPSKTDLIKLSDDAFESLNTARSLSILRHQKDDTEIDIIKDLRLFARIYSVSQGRTAEKNFALTDIYHIVDWMRSHPNIPNWAHGITWSTIESSPSYLDHISDVWHIVQVAITYSNPISVAYHATDRAINQATGKTLFSASYASVKDKLGLNINIKLALTSYFGGQLIIELLKKR